MSNYHIRQQINIQINHWESDKHSRKHPVKHKVSFTHAPEMVTLPQSITDTPVLREYVPEKKSRKVRESVEMESIPPGTFTDVSMIEEYVRPSLFELLAGMVKGLLARTYDNKPGLPESRTEETGLIVRQETDIQK